MWILVALVIFIMYWIWKNQRVENLTVKDVLGDIREKRPELYPIETMYMDSDGRSRFMMFNTDTYAGELYDYFPPKK